MKALYNVETCKFKTYDGWTEYVEDKKGKQIKGLEDAQLYTASEAARNPAVYPLEWRTVNPRVNWKML